MPVKKLKRKEFVCVVCLKTRERGTLIRNVRGYTYKVCKTAACRKLAAK